MKYFFTFICLTYTTTKSQMSSTKKVQFIEIIDPETEKLILYWKRQASELSSQERITEIVRLKIELEKQRMSQRTSMKKEAAAAEGKALREHCQKVSVNEPKQRVAAKFRTNSIVTAIDSTCDATFQRVGKALAIVERTPPHGGKRESMTIFKLNYNGQLYVIPSKYLRKARVDEKKNDPRNQMYWKNMGEHINLTHVSHKLKATKY